MKLKSFLTGMDPFHRSGLNKTLLGMLVSSILFLSSTVPVNADNEGDVYYIPYDQINAWRYWENHITDNEQQIDLDTSSGKIYSYTRSTLVYHYTTGNEANSLAATLQSGGCNVNINDTDKTVTGVCPFLVANGSFDQSYRSSEDNSITLLHASPVMSGTITQPSAYSTADRIYLTSGVSYTFAFWINTNLTGSSGVMNLYYSDGSVETVNAASVGITNLGAIHRYTIINNNDSRWATISIPHIDGKTNFQISPIYYGMTNGMTDETMQTLNIKSKTVTAIENASSDIVDELIVINGTLSTANSRLNTINSSIGTMNTNLGGKLDTTNTRLNTINSSIGTMNTNLGSKLDTLHSDMETNNNHLGTIQNYLNNGTSTTQSAVQSNSQSNNELNTNTTEYISHEDAAIDDMEIGLNNIDTSPALTGSFKFIQSANWVTQQFNRLVTNTPFEMVIAFSLVLGLSLVFIGKVR